MTDKWLKARSSQIGNGVHRKLIRPTAVIGVSRKSLGVAVSVRQVKLPISTSCAITISEAEKSRRRHLEKGICE